MDPVSQSPLNFELFKQQFITGLFPAILTGLFQSLVWSVSLSVTEQSLE